MIRKALQEDPESFSYLDSLGWVLFKRGKLKEALEPMKKAAEQMKAEMDRRGTTPDATIFEHLGDVYFQLQELDKASDAWRQAAKAAARPSRPINGWPRFARNSNHWKNSVPCPSSRRIGHLEVLVRDPNRTVTTSGFASPALDRSSGSWAAIVMHCGTVPLLPPDHRLRITGEITEMAGHSHSANIAHRKGLVDAKRGKLFTKLCRAVYVAARNGGGDPSANMRLRYSIDKARLFSVPKENIERSIKKATGELGGESFEEVVYEGYGPGGVAVLCEALTDNRNRTASELRRRVRARRR